MNKQKAFQLEAQEFHFGPYDEFSTKQDGQICYGSKEELKNALQSRVSKHEFSSVVKTAHHSYTFIPKKKKDSTEEIMPVRVFLSREDTLGEFSNAGFFDDLIVTSRAINKSHNINRLALAAGATALVMAGTMAFVSLAGHAMKKEDEYNQQRLAPYIQEYEQSQREEVVRKQISEENRKAGEEEQATVGITNEDLEQSKGLAK